MTFTEAENAYLASQRLGRRPHRPRRQPQVMPVGFFTHRAGFRLDSGLVFETDDAASNSITHRVGVGPDAVTA
jgi:hypothetical protein